MATVRGDIHDLGKNIVIMMLRSYGILVYDLGVDVAPEEVVRKAEELRPDIIGLSGLLTVATDGMKATVDAVRGAEKRLGRRVPVIIGGGIVDEQTSQLDRRRPVDQRRLARRAPHPRGDRRGAAALDRSRLPALRFPDRLPERQAHDEGPGAHRRCHMIGPWRRTYEYT